MPNFDVWAIVKVVVGILVLVALIVVLMSYTQGASLISTGMTDYVSNAPFEAPWGVGALAAEYGFGLFGIVDALKAFVTWCLGVVAVTATWRLLKMFL